MRQEALERFRAGRRLTVLPAGTSRTDISGKGAPDTAPPVCVCSRALRRAIWRTTGTKQREGGSHWHLLSPTRSGLCRGTCPQRCTGRGLPGSAAAAAGSRRQSSSRACRAQGSILGLGLPGLQPAGILHTAAQSPPCCLGSQWTGRGRHQQSMLPHSPQTAPHTEPTARHPAPRT